MWYYFLIEEEIKNKIKNGEGVGSLSYGKVYRRDEIDRSHMNVFHQIDGWYICPKSMRVIGKEDLQDVLAKVAKAVYGENIKYRFNEDTFPYTHPSLEMEIEKDGRWLEVLGAGVVKGAVLKNLGVDPEIYNGWAFGFGLERLAMMSMDLPDIRLLWSNDERVKKQLVLGNKFKEVSKFPAITRDVSFVVNKVFTPNDYYDVVRYLGGDLVEEVKLLDTYANEEKFGQSRTSYTFRIVYRSNERTLISEEVDKIQAEIYKATQEQFEATLR
jgi:phenylalanyl-tRNA synthetase alpha chain